MATLVNKCRHCICCSLLALSQVACGDDSGGSASTPAADVPTTLKAQITQLESSGALPALDRSSSIAGPDANNNGVRDDIEAYVATLPITPVQKAAVMQDARAQQLTLTVDLTDVAALDRVGALQARSTNCVVDSFIPNDEDGYNLLRKMEAITANTRERAQQYLAYNRASSGSVTRLPSGNTCDP